MPECYSCGTTDDVYPCRTCDLLTCRDCVSYWPPSDNDFVWFPDCEHQPYRERPNNWRRYVEDFSTLARNIHENAIAHGFATKETRRPMNEHSVLIHSEISEMLEAYREHHDYEPRYGVNGKPEGVPSEAADVVIRALDFAEEYSLTENEDHFNALVNSIASEQPVKLIKATFIDYLALLHEFTTLPQKITSVYYIIGYTIIMCRNLGIDLDKALAEKLHYNLGRPYRHGNKLL